MAGFGVVWQGRKGELRQGKARIGMAGKVGYGMIRRVAAWHGRQIKKQKGRMTYE